MNKGKLAENQYIEYGPRGGKAIATTIAAWPLWSAGRWQWYGRITLSRPVRGEGVRCLVGKVPDDILLYARKIYRRYRRWGLIGPAKRTVAV